MSLKLELRSISDWVTTISAAAKTTAEFSIESGFLQDTLKEICDRSGVAGSVFKLGAMALDLIPEADAETRIGAKLSRTFLATLNKELSEQDPDEPHRFIGTDVWRKYQQEHLDRAAINTLSARFTWLKVMGERGRKSSRSWPLVNELSDFAYVAVLGASESEGVISDDARIFADTVRGRVHEALAHAVDELLTDSVVETALRIEVPAVTREALRLLNEQYTVLKDTHLFNEVPQSALYISPTIRVIDYSQLEVEENWEEIQPMEAGDDFLVQELAGRFGAAGVIVLEGEMGVGKSCMMRQVTSLLSEQFLRDARQAVVSANWRDIYNANDLIDGVARHISDQFGLSIPNLEKEEGLVLLIDGFDEMKSHESSVIDRYFQSLSQLSKSHKSPLVLAMRSTVVSDALRRQWKDSNVLVLKIDSFSDEDTDRWAENWCACRKVTDVTGDGLRELCGGIDELTRTPLLLFMLARYVQPATAGRSDEPLTRAEIFRLFVDETIRGKARLSGERAGLEVKEQNYRLLLQEIAWMASWPKHGGKCPMRMLRDRVCGSGDDLESDFGFADLRTAFVLQFFEPGTHSDEFEFHPESFRHYLLAEWCVRTQWEAMLYVDVPPPHPMGKKREEARNALAQFPLREVERDLLNEIYESLPKMLSTDEVGRDKERVSEQRKRARATFGLTNDALVADLFGAVRRESNAPPNHSWAFDSSVGVPEGQWAEKSFEQTRMLVNHWDQSLISFFGLSRGIEERPQLTRQTLGRFLGFSKGTGRNPPVFNLSKINLGGEDLRGAVLWGANLQGANLGRADLRGASLVEANLEGADLERANLKEADLEGANLEGANLGDAHLVAANLGEANLSAADLRDANLGRTLLWHADLSEAHLVAADLEGAALRAAVLWRANLQGATLGRADLKEANLSHANLVEADLGRADLRGASLEGAHIGDADLKGADLSGADLGRAHLRGASLVGADLRVANLEGADLEGAHLEGAHLRRADLRHADLRHADLRHADLEGADLRGAKIDERILSASQRKAIKGVTGNETYSDEDSS